MHPNEPSLEELQQYLAEALKSGDRRKVHAIEVQMKRQRKEQK